MKLFSKESKAAPDKKLVTEYYLLQNWLHQNEQKMRALYEQGVPQDTPEWEELKATRLAKMKRFQEVSKLVGVL
jgi:hypothetical protein